MINRKAIETAVKKIARDGTREANDSAANILGVTDACDLIAEVCRVSGVAKGYGWARHSINWREVSARYAFKEITLAGLRNWQGIYSA